jgi:hypothetical protein
MSECRCAPPIRSKVTGHKKKNWFFLSTIRDADKIGIHTDSRAVVQAIRIDERVRVGDQG